MKVNNPISELSKTYAEFANVKIIHPNVRVKLPRKKKIIELHGHGNGFYIEDINQRLWIIKWRYNNEWEKVTIVEYYKPKVSLLQRLIRIFTT